MKNKACCVVLMLVLGSPAWGQQRVPFDCKMDAVCLAQLEQAQQQSKAGQLSEAEASYKLAYELSHDAHLLFNIARVLDKRDQVAEAATYYQRFIASSVDDESQKVKAREFLALLEEKRGSPANRRSGEPIHKKGWFWGAFLGGVAAVGLGVGLGVGLSNRGPMVPSGTNTIAF